MHPSNTAASSISGPGSPNPTLYQQNWPPNAQDHYSHQHYPNDYPPQQGYTPHGGHPGYAPQAPYAYPLTQNGSHQHYPPPEDMYSNVTQVNGASGSFTRNLIGSLTASAFRLKDHKDVQGIWFVLQDLSVRTEGKFRLKLSFLNLGQ
jgi:Velvet factor